MNDPDTTPAPFQLATDDKNKGFVLTFENGVSVSIRWGTMNYSDGENTAECAALVGSRFIHIPGFMYYSDDVLANRSAEEVAQFIETAARLDTPEDFKPEN